MKSDAEKIASRYEPALTGSLKEGLVWLKSNVNDKTLKIGIRNHSLNAVMAAVPIEEMMPRFIVAFRPMMHALMNGGNAVRATVVVKDSIGFHFDLANPNTAQAASSYRSDLIRGLTQQTADSIRQVLVGALSQGQSVDTTARLIRDIIGLTPQQAAAVQNFRSSLDKGSASALNYALRDKRYDGSINNAIDGNALTGDQIDAQVGRYADRMLAYRAKTIARTESLNAANLGGEMAIRQAIELGQIDAADVTRYWLVSDDELVCPICTSIVDADPDGVGLDEPFQSIKGPIQRPTAHPNCRCTLQYTITGHQDWNA